MPKIKIDKNKCIGCFACVSLCPDSFKIVNDKAIPIKETVKEIINEKEAAECCPQQAIKISG